MPVYDFNKSAVVTERLHQEIVAAPLPAPIGITFNTGETPNNLHIEFTSALTAPQETTLGTVVTNHVANPVSPPLARGFGLYVFNGQTKWDSVSTVKLGLSGQLSFARSSDDARDIEWTGELTVNMAVMGAGGLDTGAEAASTWYAVFVIADSFGVNSPAGLFSLSSTAPTLPVGYDKFRRLGWVRNTGSSNFRKYSLVGSGYQRFFHYDESFSNLRVLTNGSATSFTSVSLAAYVPPTAFVALLAVSYDCVAAGGAVDMRTPGSTITDTPNKVAPGIITTARHIQQRQMRLSTSQAVEYKVDGALDVVDIVVVGYIEEI
jgi:hypothetical protein